MDQDVRPVSATPVAPHDARMDPVGMLVLAIGSLACLELAALNLRGDPRRRPARRAEPSRPRR